MVKQVSNLHKNEEKEKGVIFFFICPRSLETVHFEKDNLKKRTLAKKVLQRTSEDYFSDVI